MQHHPDFHPDWIPDILRRLSGAPLLYQGRQVLLRLDAPDMGGMVVKVWSARLQPTWLLGRRAQRCFARARSLEELGIPSPQALFCLSRRLGAWKSQALFACRELAPAVQIRVLHGAEWIRAYPELAQAALADREQVLTATARSCARLHQAGWLHHDLTAGNILLSPGSEQPWIASLIDLDRLHPCAQVSRKRGLSQLAKLEFTQPQDQECLIDAYCQERGLASAGGLAIYQAALRRHLRCFDWKNRSRAWRHPLRHKKKNQGT